MSSAEVGAMQTVVLKIASDNGADIYINGNLVDADARK